MIQFNSIKSLVIEEGMDLVIDSASLIPKYKNCKLNFLLSLEDVIILYENLPSKNLKFLTIRKNTKFIPYLLAISKLKKLTIEIYTDNMAYWKYWVNISKIN